MRYLNIIIAVFLFTVAAGSQAADCEWEVNGLNISTSGSFTYACVTEDRDNVASKTVTAPAVGTSQCSISVDLDYLNSGSCTSPNIIVRPTEITTVHVVNNKPTVTECTARSIAGGYGYIVYNVSCSGYDFDTHIVQNTESSGYCSVAISGSGYSVSGTCSNYTVSKS